MVPSPLHLSTHTEDETEAWAYRLASCLPAATVILLDGALGTGKSVVARGIIRGMGVTEPYITSPTFTLMNGYEAGRLPVYHFDLYRLGHPEELFSTGLEEYLHSEQGVALVEWAAKGGTAIPEDHLRIVLTDEPHHPERRGLCLTAQGPLSSRLLAHLRATPWAVPPSSATSPPPCPHSKLTMPP